MLASSQDVLKHHGSRSWIAGFFLFGAASLVSSAAAQDVTVNAGSVFQRMDGFGLNLDDASVAGPSGPSDADADMYFDPVKGIGLSMARYQWSDDGSPLDQAQIAMALKAQARGAVIIASNWALPAQWTDNGTSSGSLLSQHYQDYANDCVTFVQSMSAAGVNIVAMCPKNEFFFGIDIHGFILNNLGPTFAANGLTTKIIAPEYVGWDEEVDWMAWNNVITDPACAQYVAIWGSHDYGSAIPATSYGAPTVGYPGSGFGNKYVPTSLVFGSALQGKAVWMTESWIANPMYGGSDTISDGVTTAELVYDNVVIAGAGAWLYWDSRTLSQWNDINQYYCLGNYSKFVRPGYNMIGVTGGPPGDVNGNASSGVLVSAYQDPSTGNFAIVAINLNTSSSTFNINLVGLSASSVTPYETSATLQLAQGTAIPVSGGSFSVNLDPQSVTTFVGTGSGAVPPPPPPPPPPATGPTYMLLNQASGLALGVANDATTSGSLVVQAAPDGSGAHTWTITSSGDGYFYLTNPNSGMDLNVPGASTVSGVQLIIWPHTVGATNAEWAISQNSDETFTISNRNSSLAVDDQSSSTASGNPIQQWTPNGTSAQKWSISGFTLPAGSVPAATPPAAAASSPPSTSPSAVAGAGSSSGKGACGLTGLETILVLGLLALRRRLD